MLPFMEDFQVYGCHALSSTPDQPELKIIPRLVWIKSRFLQNSYYFSFLEDGLRIPSKRTLGVLFLMLSKGYPVG